MPKKASTKVLKTCRIEKQYIEYCTMQGLNFNGLVNDLLYGFILEHQRNDVLRACYPDEIFILRPCLSNRP